MKVLNIHSRIIPAPLGKVNDLIKTLASPSDQVWPKEYWPRMRLDKGLVNGAKGGHGPIKYYVEDYKDDEYLTFRFTNPKGFRGIHKFEISGNGKNQTKIQHTIDIQTSGSCTLYWLLAIRPLHDALIEDAFNKIENHFIDVSKKPDWSLYVKLLRFVLS